MSEKRTIAAKLAAAIGEVDRIGKDGTNDFHKYSYTSAEQVYRVVRRPLLDQGLVVIPSATNLAKNGQNALIDLELTILDTESGESITAKWAGEGQDKGDKAFYKAATGGMKTWLKHLFLLPADDDPEADATVDRSAALRERFTELARKEKFTPEERTALWEFVKASDKNAQKAVERLEAGDTKGLLGHVSVAMGMMGRE